MRTRPSATLGTEMLLYAVFAFVTAAVVMWLWNAVFHGGAGVDWGTTAVLAVAIGLVMPLARRLASRSG